MTIRHRQWPGRLALILFGIFLLLAVEGLLRLVWTPMEGQGQTLHLATIDPFVAEGNEYVTKQALLVAMREQRIARVKASGTTRIFCFGGSSTLGYPYPVQKSWPKLLEARLNKLYPTKHFEVVNLGANSYGSARVLALMRGSMKYDPDLLIVSMGHNEFVEDSFRVSVEAIEKSPSGIIHKLYLAKLLAKLRPDTGMEQNNVVDVTMSGQVADFFFSPSLQGTVYFADNRRKQSVLENFKVNVEEMTEVASKKGVPLLLATVPSNIVDWPPGLDEQTPPERDVVALWQGKFNRLTKQTKNILPSEQVAGYLELTAIWSGNATINFGLGQALIGVGKPGKARQWLLAARDLDPVPVRASQGFLDAIRAVCSNGKQVPLIDFEMAFSRQSEDGLVDEALILDNVHPTQQGHLLSARTVTQVLIRNGLLPSPELSAGQVDALEQDENQIAETAVEVESDIAFTYGQLFLRQGRLRKAEEMLRLAGTNHPFARLALGSTLALQGRDDEALEVLRSLVLSHGDLVEIYPLLAIVTFNSDRFEEALWACRKGFALGSRDYRLLNLGISLLLDKHEIDEVSRWSDFALVHFPADCKFVAAKGRALEETASPQVVQAYYEEALSADPACHPAWENLGLYFLNSGETESARIVFERAISAPGDILPNHFLNLGYIYWQLLGLKQQGLSVYQRYIDFWPQGWHNLPIEVRTDPSMQRLKASASTLTGLKGKPDQ